MSGGDRMVGKGLPDKANSMLEEEKDSTGCSLKDERGGLDER